MFAEARIGLAEKKGVLVVPPSALSKGEDGTAVYVVTGDEATRTKVEIGLETPEAVEVVSGVKEGQKVLTSGRPRPRGAGEARRQAVNVAGFAARNSRVILLGIVLLSAAGLHALRARCPATSTPRWSSRASRSSRTRATCRRA